MREENIDSIENYLQKIKKLYLVVFLYQMMVVVLYAVGILKYKMPN